MTARGIRNNNPGNIKITCVKWKGLADVQDDPTFFIFSDMVYGCRALLRLLRTYYEVIGCYSVRSIINRYAPPEENDTESYINHVAQKCNVHPDGHLELTKENHLILAKAIARHENGSDADLISDETWEKAYNII